MTKLTPKTQNILLWIAQVLVAATLLWSAYMKLIAPKATVAAMWPWTGQVPSVLLVVTGSADVLGAVGLLLPGLLKIMPRLTSFAAIGIILLMLCAITFHLMRGEASVIGVNIFYGLLAVYIAWGRMMNRA